MVVIRVWLYGPITEDRLEREKRAAVHRAEQLKPDPIRKDVRYGSE